MEKINKKSPFLSIVMTGRNDDYGSDFNERLQNCVNWLSVNLEKLQIPSELVFVNCNPIIDKPSLLEKIQWGQNRKYFQIRFITVPEKVHQAYINPQVRRTVPIFEFIAKNMGVRRAKGEFILCTNADIIFAPEFFFILNPGSLDKNSYYRTDRFDFHKVADGKGDLIKSIQRNIFKVFLKGYAYEFQPGGNLQWNLFRSRLKNRLRIFKELALLKIDTFGQKMGILKDNTLWKMGIIILYDNIPQKYHTHCAGDFMLMHRSHWEKLRGYPEDTLISTHTDAILTVAAASSGVKENVLPFPVYHQDHARRYNAHDDEKNEDARTMFNRLMKEGQQMEASRKPNIYNDENWGGGNWEFEEVLI